MIQTVLEMEVANPESPNLTEKLGFMIDSGIEFSVIPAPILKKLQIPCESELIFSLKNGTSTVRGTGKALLKYSGKAGISDIVFGEKGDALLLGTKTLEILGFSLNPLTREIHKIR